MSRHRNVRQMNYDDDYAGYNDVYGRSLDEEYAVSASPSDSQYLFDRNKSTQLAQFMHEDDIEEEPEEVTGTNIVQSNLEKTRRRLDSLTIESAVANLGADEAIRMKHCRDIIYDVVGESVAENMISAHIIQAKFDAQRALHNILDGAPVDPALVIPPEPVKKPKLEEPSSRDVPKVFTTEAKTRGGTSDGIKKPEPIRVVPASKATITVGFSIPAGKERSTTPTNISLPGSKNSSKCPSPTPPTSSEGSTTTSSNTKNQKSQEYKGDAVVKQYIKDRGSSKDLLNLLVIGHVDAGKSTLMGHLLYQLEQVPKKAMHKFEQESKKIGKQSFMYAWVLDETGEERTRGITMDVGQSRFETNSKSIVLLDAPGHKDFIPNMITGASQADVAVLVVDSTNGEFETGFESGGQTREHALLVRSLGVNQLIIAVNKLDNMDWSKDRFDDIRAKLGSFLTRQAGFKEADITFIPCSGLMGINLIKKPTEPSLTQWYTGKTLLEAIDALKTPERPVGKPLRIMINDVFKGQGGVCVGGRVETGMVQAGDKILLQPIGELVTVKHITLEDGLGSAAYAGDPVILSLQGYSDVNVFSIGCVLSHPLFPCKVASKLETRLVTFDAMKIPLTKGFTGVIHIGTMTEQVCVKKLVSQLNRGTGEVIKAKPRCLPRNGNGIVDIETARPICVEQFKDVKELGRFTLRSSGVTIAAGVITKIL